METMFIGLIVALLAIITILGIVGIRLFRSNIKLERKVYADERINSLRQRGEFVPNYLHFIHDDKERKIAHNVLARVDDSLTIAMRKLQIEEKCDEAEKFITELQGLRKKAFISTNIHGFNEIQNFLDDVNNGKSKKYIKFTKRNI